MERPALGRLLDHIRQGLIEVIVEIARAWRRKLQSAAEAVAALATLVNLIELRCDGLRLSLKLPMTAEPDRDDQPRADPTITRFLPMRVKRRGVELRLVIEAERTQAPSHRMAPETGWTTKTANLPLPKRW